MWLNWRSAWRSLRGSPGFTAIAVVLLAFGIGLNTAVFSVINAILYRPLGVSAPHELVFLTRPDAGGNRRTLGSFDDVLAFADNADLFTGGAAVDIDTARLRIGLDVESITGERVTANYFEVLGVAPALGRTLVSALDGAPDAERAVVISDALWRRRFHADRAIVGQSIALGSTLFLSQHAPRYTIVGVVGPDFTGVSAPWAPTEYWVEFRRREDDLFGIATTRTVTAGMLIARLRAGVTPEQVQAAGDIAVRTSDVWVRPDGRAGSGLIASPSPPSRLPFGGGAVDAGGLGVGLLLVAGLVLAIGAANLAGLAMTRHLARRRDVAIRLSLGATRGQIARQVVTETMCLAVAGGLLGIVLSRVFVAALMRDMGGGFGGVSAPLASLAVPMDQRVVLYTAMLCLATGLAIGNACVRRMRTVTALTTTAGESLGAPSIGRWRQRHWILVPQLALSLALVLAALMSVRALMNVALVAPGFEPDRAAYVTFEGLFNQSYSAMSAPQKAAYLDRIANFPRRLLEVAHATPAIDAAAVASALPTGPRRTEVIAREGPARDRPLQTEVSWVTPEYFRAVGIPLRQGRVFDSVEVENEHPVAVVDEALARRLWPGETALGKSLTTFTGGGPARLRSYEIVGVVGAVRGPLSKGDAYALMYLPWPRGPVTDVILIGRGVVANQHLLRTLRDVARDADSGIGVLRTRMMSDVFDVARYPRRLAASLLGFCAVGGLLLAAIGFYGVMAYAVGQRRRELGIRVALGATRGDLARLVIVEGAAVAVIGSIIGVPLAWIGLHTASHYVLPIPALDVPTLVLAAVVVIGVALAACYPPARRAARVDAMAVLRAQ